MERDTTLAGTWFPADPVLLAEQLEAWGHETADVPPHPAQPPAAVLVPHAGYAYSGRVAAAVYARLDPSAYDQVLIMAPSHRVRLPLAVSVEPAGMVRTPGGPVMFDADMARQLAALPGATHLPAAHAGEHSLDIQLPLLRHFLLEKQPGIRVGGLVVGQWRWDGGRERRAMAHFAAALRRVLTPRTLVIISTDFTHYGRQFGYEPFTSHIEAGLHALDHAVFRAFAANDSAQFDAVMEETGATVCGKAPMALLLAALPEYAEIVELVYATSGQLTGDWRHSVSYLGAALWADWNAPVKPEVNAMLHDSASTQPTPLADHEAALLLRFARTALDYAVRNKRPMAPPAGLDGDALPASFDEKRGAFVTLHHHGELRGCIGEILPQRPLALVVAERAHDSALRDRRFAPVTESELPELDLEVSVLSPPWAVASTDDIELGTHGIILQKQGRSAVFLPQVAPEQGWDLPTTLTHLARKAGLPHDAWRQGAEFFVFTAQVIH